MRKVLIVEPNAADVRALRKCLRDAGLRNLSTVLKNNGQAKRHLAQRDQDGILLLNIRGADSSSMKFLDWLREQSFHKELLVIALGERNRLRAVVEACERGANTFLIKPVHVEDLKTLANRYPDHWTRSPA